METESAGLLPNASNWLVLVGWAIAGSLAVRIVISTLRGLAAPGGFGGAFWASLVGAQDYWNPFVLGAIEIVAYPILIAEGHAAYVGAWVGLKTIVQWKVWNEHRQHFNIFLIGNALVLGMSYWLSGGLPR